MNADEQARLSLLEAHVENLIERVGTLEDELPRRRPGPVLVTAEHVCGVEPAIDSATCPYASLYRRRKGCLGDACVRKSTEYYDEYRKGR